MASIAIKNLNRLRKHRAVRGAQAFFAWWWAELLGGLPPRMREFLSPRRERLIARLDGDQVCLWRDGDGQAELGRFRASDDEEIGRQVVGGALARFDGGEPQTWFLLEEADVLVQRLSLPEAAEENLRQVLGYELDRHTPFTADQVCFDYRVLEGREGSHQIRVELITVQREAVERIWKLAADRGLALDGIDVGCSQPDGSVVPLGVNLLEPQRRARRNHRHAKVLAALAALFVVLLYTVMWQSLAAKERALQAFQATTDRAAAEAREVAALRDQLSEAREAALFLTERKNSQPVIMSVLDEVTQVLPDQVWIQRLQVAGDKVDLTGQAPEASALLPLLERSDCLEGAVAKSAFTPDVQSGKERFTIEVSVKCKGVGNGPAAAG